MITCITFSRNASAQDLIVDLTPSNYNDYNVSCFGGQDGIIYITISGGTPPYFVTCNDVAVTSDTMEFLPAGYYHIHAYDSDPHFISFGDGEISLTEPPQLQLSASINVYGNGFNTSCFNCGNAIMTINATGGVPPYHYLWPDNTTNQTHSSLSAGSYNPLVTDSNGCTANSEHYLSQPSRDDWTLQGNTSNNPDSNFIGTINSKDFVFRTKNQERMRVDTNGVIKIKLGLKVDSFAGHGN